MAPLKSLFVAVLLTIVGMTEADTSRYLSPARVLTRNGQAIAPYLGYTSYGDHTNRPLYPYHYGGDYNGPLPDVGYTHNRGLYHDFRNGGNKFCSSGFFIAFLVGSLTILRTFYNVAI